MKKPSILIADDNNVSRDNLFVLLSENGFNVRAVEDGQQAIDAFLGEKFDLVITDLKMPRVDGLQLLEFIKGVNPESVVVMVTGHGTVGTAVEAMKLGAFDYVTKPLKDDLVMLTVERALSFAKLREENATLKSHLKKQYGFGKMIGYSDAMKRVFETIEKVASSDSTVIIYGESG
ncbi:MAG TPA: response regulator, partial [Syntrophales bacterium]|nr:response regulator [Syntrophales bacterium]